MFNFQVDLTKDKILKALVLFAIAIFISNIFQQLYNTMDTMIVGNVLGDTSLAAIGACTVVFDLLIGFALWVGNGLSIVVARSYDVISKINNRNKTIIKAIIHEPYKYFL